MFLRFNAFFLPASRVATPLQSYEETEQDGVKRGSTEAAKLRHLAAKRLDDVRL